MPDYETFEHDVLVIGSKDRRAKTEEGQSLLSTLHRNEQDREARRIGVRTCFWRTLVMVTFL
jgi:hypothetical protein